MKRERKRTLASMIPELLEIVLAYIPRCYHCNSNLFNFTIDDIHVCINCDYTYCFQHYLLHRDEQEMICINCNKNYAFNNYYMRGYVSE